MQVPIWVGGSIRRLLRVPRGWAMGGTPASALCLDGGSAAPRPAYRAALGGADGSVAINRVTFVAETQREVDDLVQQHLSTTFQAYARPGESLQQVIDDVALVGTPTQIAAQLERYRAAGVSHVFARFSSIDDAPARSSPSHDRAAGSGCDTALQSGGVSISLPRRAPSPCARRRAFQSTPSVPALARHRVAPGRPPTSAPTLAGVSPNSGSVA